MYAINKKKSKIWLRCILPENGRSFGSLSFKSLFLVKKQEPEQASKSPEVGEYPKNRNNVYLNEATIVTSRRKNIKILVYSTYFLRFKVSSTSTQKSCTRVLHHCLNHVLQFCTPLYH